MLLFKYVLNVAQCYCPVKYPPGQFCRIFAICIVFNMYFFIGMKILLSRENLHFVKSSLPNMRSKVSLDYVFKIIWLQEYPTLELFFSIFFERRIAVASTLPIEMKYNALVSIWRIDFFDNLLGKIQKQMIPHFKAWTLQCWNKKIVWHHQDISTSIRTEKLPCLGYWK